MTETRSYRIEKALLDVVYAENSDMSCGGKLPNGKSIVAVMIFIYSKNIEKGEKQMSIEDANRVVAEKVRNEWMKRNVYPLQEKSISQKIKDDYNALCLHCKQFNSEKFKKHIHG